MKFSTDAFISYSANYEDVYLNRIFSKQPVGFYVDIGAAHPFFENDTKALYERGWNGINVEPSLEFFDTLATERPRDANLQLLISTETGMLTFYQVRGTGLSTADPEEAERARGKGFEVVERTVPTDTLAHILEKWSHSSIDLLKVDVEGFELTVLQSNDWSRFRPSVILVEATFPETPTRRPDNISPYLSSVGYRRVFFDGLNDYYLESTFEVGENVFDRPINVFDNFVLASHERLLTSHEGLLTSHERLLDEASSLRTFIAERDLAIRAAMQKQREDTKSLRQQAHLIEAQATDLNRSKAEWQASIVRVSDFAAKLDQALSRVIHLEKEKESLVHHRDEAHILRRSTSWRITRPLRAIRRPRRTLVILLRIAQNRLGIKKKISLR